MESPHAAVKFTVEYLAAIGSAAQRCCSVANVEARISWSGPHISAYVLPTDEARMSKGIDIGNVLHSPVHCYWQCPPLAFSLASLVHVYEQLADDDCHGAVVPLHCIQETSRPLANTLRLLAALIAGMSTMTPGSDPFRRP
jgi:hypothetical protein